MFTVSATTAHVSGKGLTCNITAKYMPLNNTLGEGGVGWRGVSQEEKKRSLKHHCSSSLDLGPKLPTAWGGGRRNQGVQGNTPGAAAGGCRGGKKPANRAENA